MPAAGLDRVRVAVTFVLSMVGRDDVDAGRAAVSSVYVSAADRLVAVGGSSTGGAGHALATRRRGEPSLTLVAIVKLPLKFAAGREGEPGEQAVDVGDRAEAVHTPAPT